MPPLFLLKQPYLCYKYNESYHTLFKGARIKTTGRKIYRTQGAEDGGVLEFHERFIKDA